MLSTCALAPMARRARRPHVRGAIAGGVTVECDNRSRAREDRASAKYSFFDFLVKPKPVFTKSDEKNVKKLEPQKQAAKMRPLESNPSEARSRTRWHHKIHNYEANTHHTATRHPSDTHHVRFRRSCCCASRGQRVRADGQLAVSTII